MSNFIFNLELSLSNNELLKNNVQIVELKIPEPKIIVKVNSELENFDANINNYENIFKNNEEDIFAIILEITKNFGFDILEQSSAEVFPKIGKPFNIILKDKKIFIPSAKDLIISQLAIKLNLISLKNTDLVDFIEVKTKLEKRLKELGNKQFIESIWQGIHYALIMNNLKLVGVSNFKYIKEFNRNITNIIFERELNFDDSSQPKEFIINTIYFMLRELVTLRNSRDVSFDSYTNLITKISNKLTEKHLDKFNMPLIFTTAILSEASSHLGEISLHKDANKAIKEYYNNCSKLTEIFPAIVNVEDISGFLSIFGKNMYYQGEFSLSLKLYTTEISRANSDSNKEKKILELSRGLANVFTDLGFWQTAHKFASEYLHFQEINGSEYLYKTYGRLGEIELRSGNYEQAIQYYKKSIENQKKLLGENNIEGRNICYLANAELLSHGLAEKNYSYAKKIDEKENIVNLYTELGLLAFKLRKAFSNQNIIEQVLNILYVIENNKDKKIVGDNLPKALIKFVLVKLDREKYNNYAEEVIQNLIDDKYYIEALACFPYIYKKNLDDDNNSNNNVKNHLDTIQEKISIWNNSVLETDKVIPNKIIFDEYELNTQTCLNLINQVRETNDLNLLKKLSIFPVKLVAY